MVIITKIDPKIQQKDLVLKLNSITAQAFGKPVPLEETEQRFAQADALFVVREGPEIVGYAFNDQLTLIGKTVNYFGSGFIVPPLQGRGLYHQLNRQRVLEMPADAIMTRTQNPVVVAGFKRLCDEFAFSMSPDEQLRVSPTALELARQYDPLCTPRLLCQAVYGRELMTNTPLPTGLAAVLLRNVDRSSGDAKILVGEKSTLRNSIT